MKLSPAIFFLVTSVTIGLIYVFLIPPFQAPDEAHHFYRAYHIADGTPMGIKMENRFGGYLPTSLKAVSDSFRPLRHNLAQKISAADIREFSTIPLRAEQQVFIDFPNVAYYSPLGYLPQAFAIKMACLFSDKVAILFYASRIVGLLVWTFLLYLSIKIIPVQKWTLAFLALLPASLVFHSGINPDVFTYGGIFFLIASLLRLIFTEQKINYLHLSCLLVISLLITVNKVVYAPVFLLSCLIPVEKFRHRTEFITLLSIAFIAHAVVLVVWYKIAGDLFIPYDSYNPLYREDKQLNPGIDPSSQLKFILSNPIEFVKIFHHSFWETFPYSVKHYIGKFGWEANYLPNYLTRTLVVTALAVTIFEDKQPHLYKWIHRACFLLAGLLMTWAFAIVIYMQWTPPGDEFIRSLGGRYFIPIFPFFLLAINLNKISIPVRLLQWIVMIPSILANIGCFIFVLQRYYG